MVCGATTERRQTFIVAWSDHKIRYFVSLWVCLVEGDDSGWLHGEGQALQSLQVEAANWEDWGLADCG